MAYYFTWTEKLNATIEHLHGKNIELVKQRKYDEVRTNLVEIKSLEDERDGLDYIDDVLMLAHNLRDKHSPTPSEFENQLKRLVLLMSQAIIKLSRKVDEHLLKEKTN